jgi:uncharacterized protein YoxC
VFVAENLEAEVRDLKRRVKFLEKEIRVFTPPVSALSREVMEFRIEVNQKFNTLDGKFDALIEIVRDIQDKLTELLEK